MYETLRNNYKRILFILLVIISFFLFFKIKTYFDRIQTYALTKKYYQVYDTYDTSTNSKSIKELFKESDSLHRIKNLNFDFNNIFSNNFLEFKNNYIEVLGNYNKDPKLINGGEQYINQKLTVNSKQIIETPFSAIHMDEKAFKHFNLDLINGEKFKSDDFEYKDSKVNIIMGYDFNVAYKLGDEIKFMFSEKTWTGKVSGFLKKDAKIDINFATFNLNNYVLIPFATSIDETKINSLNDEIFDDVENFIKNYYFSKNSGLFYIENHNDYRLYKKQVDEICKKYNLSFELLKGY